MNTHGAISLNQSLSLRLWNNPLASRWHYHSEYSEKKQTRLLAG
jgi:hypothetical protein